MALSGGERRFRSAASPRTSVTAGELAWLLLGPAVLTAVPVVALLARPLGRIAFAPARFHYWATELVVPKSTVQAGYVLTVGFAIAYALAIVLARGRLELPSARRRALVLGTQLTLLAFLAIAWIAQRHVRTNGVHSIFFTLPTVCVAAGLAALAAAWIGPGRRVATPPAVRRLLARTVSSRLVRLACLGIAVALTAAWLLPAVATDRSFALAPSDVVILDRFFFDEAMSVLNGRSPLVNMAAYGTVWPYLTALPLGAFGGSYLAFSLLMATITGSALLALYGILRRVTRHPAAALGLYVPVLATSLFTIRAGLFPGFGEVRYYPANYFGVFPLRYAGPYLLAWLTVRWIDAAQPRRGATPLLFAAAGLVAVNNLDFGVAALAGTFAAAVCTLRPASRGELLRLGRGAGLGLAAALALVSAFTLVRAGSLPSLHFLTVYGRTFASGGYGDLPLPGLGFHLILTATFVAALATAAVRARLRDEDRALTGMLAWSGIFGLGASVYFYAYRSHVYTVVQLFSAWALALALLVVAIVRAGQRGSRRPAPPELAVLLCFGLAVCSIVQLPQPWSELRRVRATAPTQALRNPVEVAAVRSQTSPGEHVAILDAIGHRVAREAGVVDVSPYTGLDQIGTTEQLEDVLRLLRRERGTRVFLATTAAVPASVYAGTRALLARRGYRLVRTWPQLAEYVADSG